MQLESNFLTLFPNKHLIFYVLFPFYFSLKSYQEILIKSQYKLLSLRVNIYKNKRKLKKYPWKFNLLLWTKIDDPRNDYDRSSSAISRRYKPFVSRTISFFQQSFKYIQIYRFDLLSVVNVLKLSLFYFSIFLSNTLESYLISFVKFRNIWNIIYLDTRFI